MKSSYKNALVLSAGGARAAYQAGVLKSISEIINNDLGSWPFQIITAISAGAINAGQLASGNVSFQTQVNSLVQIWNEITSEQVFRTDFASLSKISAGWIKDLGFGGMLSKSHSTHLLDSTPLKHLLEDHISCEQIHKNIANKILHREAMSRTSYATGTCITFFDSLQTEEWTRSSRIGQRIVLAMKHILSSSAIPFIFEPVKIGKSYFGDGRIRSNAPFSPAIHLGTDRILAIGVRYMRSGLEVRDLNSEIEMESVVISDIAGIMFNSNFLDAIEFDYERLRRINAMVDMFRKCQTEKNSHHLKKIPTLLIQPSINLGTIAIDEFHHFPKMLRYLLSGI